MIFNSGWTKLEIEALTYKELFDYVEIFYELESETWFEFLKAFAINNCESTAVAMHGKKADFNKYMHQIRKRKLTLDTQRENAIEEQFEELDFG